MPDPASSQVTSPENLRVLRRSPGRLRLNAPGLIDDGDSGLARLAAADGVLKVELSQRTGNLLIGFDEARIDEADVLALIAVKRATDRPSPPRATARRSPPRADARAPARSGWLRAERSETIHAPAAVCMAELIDFERHPDWQAYVTAVTILQRDRRGRGTRVATRARVAERELEFTTSYRFPSPHRVLFEQTDGELEAVRGSWSFRSLRSGRSRVTHVLEVKPGFRLGLVLRGALYEQLRETVLDHFMSELRLRVECRGA